MQADKGRTTQINVFRKRKNKQKDKADMRKNAEKKYQDKNCAHRIEV